MKDNGYNPFEEHGEDYLFQTVTGRGRRKTYSWSLVSLICGIISVICCSGYAGIILGALAIVFAIVSRRNLGYFDSMAIGGLVLGIIGFVLGIAVLIAIYSMSEAELEQFIEKFFADYYSETPDGAGNPDV